MPRGLLGWLTTLPLYHFSTPPPPPELKESVASLQTQYRAEKQRRKEVEQALGEVKEELQDARSDKENLDKVGVFNIIHFLVLFYIMSCYREM